jgi:hypothetical protein
VSETDRTAEAVERLKLLALGCAVTGLDHLPVVDRANAKAFAADIHALLAERDRLRAALKTYHEFDRHIHESLGEAVHTGLRKGVDGLGSAEAWRAIANMQDDGWSQAIAYALWGLKYGLENKLEAARTALTTPKEDK